MGARAVLNAAGNKTDSIRHQSLGDKHRAAAWLLESSRGDGREEARLAWATLTKGASFTLPA
jgi:hypothetical protein